MQLDQLVEGGEEPKFSVLVRQLRRLYESLLRLSGPLPSPEPSP